MTLDRSYPGKNPFRRAVNHVGTLAFEGIESGKLALHIICQVAEDGSREFIINDGDSVQMYVIPANQAW